MRGISLKNVLRRYQLDSTSRVAGIGSRWWMERGTVLTVLNDFGQKRHTRYHGYVYFQRLYKILKNGMQPISIVSV